MTDPSTTKRCKSQRAGHNPALVQLLRAGNATEPGETFVPCTVTEAEGDGWFTVRITDTGEEIRYWNHDPERVATLPPRTDLLINQRWSLMGQIIRGSTQPLMSILTWETPCPTGEPTGGLFEQLLSHGGATISAREALDELDDESDSR